MSQTVGKPIPVPDEISAPFFDGAREGRLMLQHRRACDRWSSPVRERCPHCFAAKLEWQQASGAAIGKNPISRIRGRSPEICGSSRYNLSFSRKISGIHVGLRRKRKTSRT